MMAFRCARSAVPFASNRPGAKHRLNAVAENFLKGTPNHQSVCSGVADAPIKNDLPGRHGTLSRHVRRQSRSTSPMTVQRDREAGPAWAASESECACVNPGAAHSSGSEVNMFNDQVMVDFAVVLNPQARIEAFKTADQFVILAPLGPGDLIDMGELDLFRSFEL